MFGQHQIWYKTEKEVTELIVGPWKMEKWTFEGREKTIDPKDTFGFVIYRKNDSLKISELIYTFDKSKVIQKDLSFSVEKDNSQYHACTDYTYKIYCQEIRFIDSTKIILEEGPNISTYKRIIR